MTIKEINLSNSSYVSWEGKNIFSKKETGPHHREIRTMFCLNNGRETCKLI